MGQHRHTRRCGNAAFSTPVLTAGTLRCGVRQARVAGNLSKVVLFALRHVERKDGTITQTRKAGLPLSKPQLLHVGVEVRSVIRAWAEEEGVSRMRLW